MDLSQDTPVGKRRERPVAVVLLLALAAGLLYVGVGRSGRGPEGWLTDLDAAKHLAAQSGRPIFVVFSAPWCPPCRLMKAEVFPEPHVREALAGFVTVHIDTDEQVRLSSEYQVLVLPTLLVLDPGGKTVAREEGAMSDAGLVRWLQTALEGKPAPGSV